MSIPPREILFSNSYEHRDPVRNIHYMRGFRVVSGAGPRAGGLFSGLFAAIFVASVLIAQQPVGQVQLEVKDPSGAAMQASGNLSGSATTGSRSFQTDAQGKYAFTNLPFGRYQVTVSSAGFATQTLRIDVQSGAPVVRTVTMALAASTSKIDVVAATPLAGTDLSTDQVAGAVQTVNAEDIQNSGAIDLADLMNRRLNGVSLNEMQANPFQVDVNFRGYTASPLLGTPEGVSVFLDGVRQNQPLGDVVSWDLIPKNAISEVALMPGSDPLFGLNTLGGALSATTKDGVTSPGVDGSIIYGSSNRKAAQAAYGGGKPTGFNWFGSGNLFHESGWRFDSPSEVRQSFARLGWRAEKTDIALTFSYADNRLIGNGVQDYRLLQTDYSSVYTIPDVTVNRSPAVNFILRHTFSGKLTFSGNAYYRHIRTNEVNPNHNSDALGLSAEQPTPDEQATLTAAGYTGFPVSGADPSNTPFPKWNCIAEAIEGNNPDQTCDALTIYSTEIQNEYGFAGQATWTTSPRVGHNQLTAGASADRGSVDFVQNSQYGYINPDHTITGVAAWQDGTANLNPMDSRVSLHGLTPDWSLYVTDTLTIAKTLNLTVSGRYNRLRIDNSDRISPIPGPGSLDGDYVFERFNPAVGLTWSPIATLNTYVSYTQGSRAPTSIELGCADPANPCSLPNALASDPPLQQVVTKTWEAGLRGKAESSVIHNLSWSAGAFRAENTNDILFVSSPQLGTGYFKNFARTQREGFDADLDGRIGHLSFGLDWTWLQATYESPATADGSANDTSDSALSGFPGLDGTIYINPGNRIPLIPKQNGKAFAEFAATKKLTFGLNEVATSSSYARGNENNAYQPDGKYYIGPGVSPGYAVTNLKAHYDLAKHFQFVLQIDNVFDRHYYTAAILSHSVFNSQGTVRTQPFPVYTNGPDAGEAPTQSVSFLTPGAPRRAWAELRVRF